MADLQQIENSIEINVRLLYINKINVYEFMRYSRRDYINITILKFI